MPIRNVGSDTPIRLNTMNSRDSRNAGAVDAGEHAHRHADQQGEQRRHEGELERRRRPLEEQAGHRLRQAIADAELTVRRRPHEFRILHDERLVEPERMHQRIRCAGV